MCTSTLTCKLRYTIPYPRMVLRRRAYMPKSREGGVYRLACIEGTSLSGLLVEHFTSSREHDISS